MTSATAPLSLQQQFLSMFAPQDGAEPQEGPFGPWYHGVKGWRFRGPLDRAALQQAAGVAVEVHPALRSRLVFGEEPHQTFHDTVTCQLSEVELSAEGEDADLAVEKFLNMLETQKFSVSDLPHMRLCVGRLGAQDHVVALVAHHVAMDGHSMDLIMETVLHAYHDLTRHGAVDAADWQVPGYDEYARRQQAALSSAPPDAKLAYWESLLEGRRMVGIPADRPAGPTRQGTAVYRFCVNEDLITQARFFARTQRSTLYMVLVTAFNLMVAEASGRHDVLIPTITHGRPRVDELGYSGIDFASTVGPFFNFVPMMTALGGATTLGEAHGVVRSSVSEAMEHEVAFPLIAGTSPHIMETFAEPHLGVCAFQSFEFETDGRRDLETVRTSEVRRRLLSASRGSDIPNGALFTVETRLSSEAYGSIRYDPGQFDLATISGWVSRFDQLLGKLTDSPDTPLREEISGWPALGWGAKADLHAHA